MYRSYKSSSTLTLMTLSILDHTKWKSWFLPIQPTQISVFQISLPWMGQWGRVLRTWQKYCRAYKLYASSHPKKNRANYRYKMWQKFWYWNISITCLFPHAISHPTSVTPLTWFPSCRAWGHVNLKCRLKIQWFWMLLKFVLAIFFTFFTRFSGAISAKRANYCNR